jgi:hypothetical protein
MARVPGCIQILKQNCPAVLQKTILVLKLCRRQVVIRGRFKMEGDFPKITTQPTLPLRHTSRRSSPLPVRETAGPNTLFFVVMSHLNTLAPGRSKPI